MGVGRRQCIGNAGQASEIVVGDRVLQPEQAVRLNTPAYLDRVVDTPELVDVHIRSTSGPIPLRESNSSSCERQSSYVAYLRKSVHCAFRPPVS
jgi:hypothetical protein